MYVNYKHILNINEWAKATYGTANPENAKNKTCPNMNISVYHAKNDLSLNNQMIKAIYIFICFCLKMLRD